MPRSRPSSSPFVACLLPVRDGERELAGWFASGKRFADAVVALDDGTGMILSPGSGLRTAGKGRIRVVDPAAG